MKKAFSGLAGRIITDPNTGKKYKIPIFTKEEKKKVSEIIARRELDAYYKQKPRKFLKENSMLNEKDILDRSFKNLNPVSDDFVELAKSIKKIAGDYKRGERYNVFMQGEQGRGKTTLSACLINDVVNNSPKPTMCAIVNATKIGELVNTYDDSRVEREQKKSNFNVFLKRLKEECDVLVIDDLGKETNLQGEQREANNLIQSAWYRIGDIMLDKNKAVVITSNFTTNELGYMYNSATLSRLFRGTKNHSYIFDSSTIPDMRINGDDDYE